MLEVRHRLTDARRAAGVVVSMLTVTRAGSLKFQRSHLEDCDSWDRISWAASLLFMLFAVSHVAHLDNTEWENVFNQNRLKKTCNPEAKKCGVLSQY